MRCHAHPPLPMPVVIVSRPGYRIGRSEGRRQYHAGVDLRAQSGTPYYAIEDGVIAGAWPEGSRATRGYGRMVVVRSERSGIYVAGAHLDRVLGRVGERVRAGQVLGYTGATDDGAYRRPIAPHLHLEMRRVPWPSQYPTPDRPGWRNWVDPLRELEVLGLEFDGARGRIREGSRMDCEARPVSILARYLPQRRTP